MKSIMSALVAFVFALAYGAAGAEEAVTKSNGTPLKSAPARSASTAWRVNSGFPLLVVDEKGDWLKVSSGRLPDGDGDLWVHADQVVAADPGEAAAAAGATDADGPVIGYRIRLTGTTDMKFMLECRVIDDGHVLVDHHFNRLPRTYEYPGDSISCVLFKKQHHGGMQIDLIAIHPTSERLIGTAHASDYPTSIFARSDGEWGKAAVVRARRHDLVLN